MQLLELFRFYFRRKEPDELNYHQLMNRHHKEIIGQGHTTTVYKSTWHGVSVAIKDMPLIYSQQSFDNEKNIMKELTALQSPHIVQYFGFAQAPPHRHGHCIVMEWQPYCLADVIDLKDPFEWRIRYDIIVGLLNGVGLMHANDIVHCDIKSGNLLLTEEYVIKICDFGMAKKIDEKIIWCGTAGWMAPEVGVRPHSKKSDIFSVAVTMWEIVAWKCPYDSLPSGAIDAETRRGVRLPLPANCPISYARAITWGWAAKPRNRPSAEELLQAVNTLN